MYANQPAVRTVVDLIAENVSQLGLKLYERVSDTERRARLDHPAARDAALPERGHPAGPVHRGVRRPTSSSTTTPTRSSSRGAASSR